jgi:hypothetical protein
MIKIGDFMDYAITLYFNKTAEDIINGFINEIAKNNGNKYMVENNIKPHLSISLFEYNGNINSIIELLDKNIPKMDFNVGNIILASIGIFNPNVLYIAPVVNKYLLELNEKINELLYNNVDIKLDRYYTGGQWIPHISLGVKLDKGELINGINALINNFQIISANINKIALEECEPLKEIKIWNL